MMDPATVKAAVDIGKVSVDVLITIVATIYKFLQEKVGLTAEEIHSRVQLELDATAKALADAEQREKDLYSATHPNG